MASSWGTSWGTSWAVSWDAVDAPVIEIDTHDGGDWQGGPSKRQWKLIEQAEEKKRRKKLIEAAQVYANITIPPALASTPIEDEDEIMLLLLAA